jgi:hypothetical protein
VKDDCRSVDWGNIYVPSGGQAQVWVNVGIEEVTSS